MTLLVIFDHNNFGHILDKDIVHTIVKTIEYVSEIPCRVKDWSDPLNNGTNLPEFRSDTE